MSKDLHVHDLISVKVLGDHPRTYRSRIEELREDKVIIAWPTENGVGVPVYQNERLLISITRKGSIYGFEAVVEALELAPLALITLQAEGPPEFIERREDVRVNARLPVTLGAKIVSISSYRDAPQDGVIIRSHTLTISAGGFTFKHQSDIPSGIPFDVSLALPDEPKTVNLEAKVVRSEPYGSAAGGHLFEIGLTYLRITERARARIVRYVFKAQTSQSQDR